MSDAIDTETIAHIVRKKTMQILVVGIFTDLYSPKSSLFYDRMKESKEQGKRKKKTMNSKNKNREINDGDGGNSRR